MKLPSQSFYKDLVSCLKNLSLSNSTFSKIVKIPFSSRERKISYRSWDIKEKIFSLSLSLFRQSLNNYIHFFFHLSSSFFPPLLKENSNSYTISDHLHKVPSSYFLANTLFNSLSLSLLLLLRFLSFSTSIPLLIFLFQFLFNF